MRKEWASSENLAIFLRNEGTKKPVLIRTSSAVASKWPQSTTKPVVRPTDNSDNRRHVANDIESTC